MSLNKEDIIRMAREAGLDVALPANIGYATFTVSELQPFAALVAAAEREECAKVAWGRFGIAGRYIAGAIRARGQHEPK